MLAPEKVIEYYFGTVVVLGGIVILLGIKYTLKRWRSLPPSRWVVQSFAVSILALVAASLIEAPTILMGSMVMLAFAAGFSEELVKLLPLKLFQGSPGWERWKLTVGTGLFLGLIEGIFYTAGIFVLGQEPYLVIVRLVLIGLHTVWAAVSVGFLLGEKGLKRFAGLAFSMTAHSLYDLTPLAFISGYGTEVLLPLAVASTLFMLALPEMAKRAMEIAGRVVPEKGDEREKALEETLTSSP